jgi:hypothetical protein
LSCSRYSSPENSVLSDCQGERDSVLRIGGG